MRYIVLNISHQTTVELKVKTEILRSGSTRSLLLTQLKLHSENWRKDDGTVGPRATSELTHKLHFVSIAVVLESSI